MYTMDFSDVYDLIKEGDYNVIVENAEVLTSQTGKEYIKITLKTLDKGRLIFHNIWKNAETNTYNPRNFNLIGKALKLVDKKQYPTLQAILEDFKGKTCTVTIKHNEYNGKTYANVSNFKELETTFGQFKELPF